MDGKLILIDGSSAAGRRDQRSSVPSLTATILWLDFKPADPDGVALLRNEFQLHPLAIEAVSDFGQRPKVEDFGNVVYLVGYGVTGKGRERFRRGPYLRCQGLPDHDQERPLPCA